MIIKRARWPFFCWEKILSDLETLEALIAPVVESFGCELWGVDYRPMNKSALLRVFIDRSDGVTLKDCSDISYQLSGMLDVEDPIKVPYTLEVSSPGIDRPLLRLEHFIDHLGHDAKVRLKWPIDGSRNFRGVLSGVDGEEITMNVDGQEISFPFDSVSRGRLIADLQFGKKGKTR